MSSVVYAGNQAEVSFTAADFDRAGMTDVDVVGVQLSIFDALGALIVTATMGFDVDRWTYLWATPTSFVDETYRLEAVLTALDGGTSTAWGEYIVAARLTTAEPATKHYVAPWCTETDLPPGRLTDSNGNTIADVPLLLMISAATEVLFKRSRRKYRTGRSIVRPTRVAGSIGLPYLYPYSSMTGFGEAWGFAAGWSLLGGLGMGWSQNGADLTEIRLQAPVTRINSVMVDGAALPGSAYTLYDRRRLVRNVDAAGTTASAWPWNQQLALPISSPGTWQIDYEWGTPPPDMGRLACAELAIELALAFSGQDACRLPSRVQRVASQGVDVAVGDALAYLEKGMIGLPMCDLFVETENPSHARRRSVFMSPETVLRPST